MTDRLLHDPQKYDAESSRLCLACGHALPHNAIMDEGSARRCAHVTIARESCENPHKRYSAKCAAKNTIDSCWISEEPCECWEEDRLIADLTAHVNTLNVVMTKAALGSVLR